jgi:integrase
MPKTPRVPPYCHHKPSNRAYCRIGGKFLYLGPYDSQESRDAYAATVADILARRPIGASAGASGAPAAYRLTVRELVDRYVAHADAYYVKNGEPTSEAGNVTRACETAAASFGNLPADEFGPLCLKTVRDKFIANGQTRVGVNGSVRRIVRMFKWAAAEELTAASTHHALTLVAGLRAGRTTAKETKPVRPVADSVVDATLPHLPAIVADMVRLQRLTGMRPGEVCSLRPCDVDRAGDVWTYRPASHKTEHHGLERVVFIGPLAQEVLLRYLARESMAFCFRPCDSEAKRRAEQHAARTTPLSCGNVPGSNVAPSPLRRAGERYLKDSYANAVRRACVRAQLPHWTPNQLRHTAATAARAAFGLDGAQIVLGHAHARVTEVYAERDAEKGRAIARQIG